MTDIMNIVNEVKLYCDGYDMTIEKFVLGSKWNAKNSTGSPQYKKGIPMIEFYVDKFSPKIEKFVNDMYTKHGVFVEFLLSEQAFKKFQDELRNMFMSVIDVKGYYLRLHETKWKMNEEGKFEYNHPFKLYFYDEHKNCSLKIMKNQNEFYNMISNFRKMNVTVDID